MFKTALSVVRQPLAHTAGTYVTGTAPSSSSGLTSTRKYAHIHGKWVSPVSGIGYSVPPGAGTGTLQSLRFTVSFQLLALGSVAAAHSSGLKADVGLRAEGVLT